MKEQVSFDHINQITLGDPAATKGLLEVFVRQNLMNITQMQEHVVRQNWAELKKVSHKLKSSLALVGMQANRALAEELENTAGTDINRTHTLVNALISATTDALSEIQRELNKR